MKRFMILACVLALVVFVVPANAGDYTRHNALEIQRTVGDDYESRDSLLVHDASGVTPLFSVDSDGSVEMYDSSNAKVWGISAYGNAEYNQGVNVATLGSDTNTTGDIDWSAGTSDFSLSAANLYQYQTFLVVTGDSGASPYTDNLSYALSKSGIGVRLVDPTAQMHGKCYEFINVSGTTNMVLYHPNGRINQSGTTITQSTEDIGDSIRAKAIFTPSAVSGWYVEDIRAND